MPRTKTSIQNRTKSVFFYLTLSVIALGLVYLWFSYYFNSGFALSLPSFQSTNNGEDVSESDSPVVVQSSNRIPVQTPLQNMPNKVTQKVVQLSPAGQETFYVYEMPSSEENEGTIPKEKLVEYFY